MEKVYSTDDIFSLFEQKKVKDLFNILSNHLRANSQCVTARNDLGRTLLHQVAFYGHTVLVGLLVRSGANVDATSEAKGDGVGSYQKTPLHLAVQQGKIAAVYALVKNGADLNAVDARGKNAVHYAAAHNRIKILNFLLGKDGIKFDVADTKDQLTPLLIATGRGYDDIVEKLVEKGASPSRLDNHGRTSLHRAVCGKKQRASLFFISWSQNKKNTNIINSKDNGGKTALHHAAITGNTAITQGLCDGGADISIRDGNGKNGKTAYQYAAEKHHDAVIGILDSCVEDVNASTEEVDSSEEEKGHYNRVLHTLAKEGNLILVNDLLKRGAVVDVLDKKCRTPLQYASKKGHASVAEALLDSGANPNLQYIEKIQLYDGDDPDYRITPSALHLAAEKGYHVVVNVLCEKGANTNLKDESEYTPLMCALVSYDDYLKNRSDSSDSEDDQNQNFEAVVRMLVANNADVNAADEYGNTPLSYAKENDHIPAEIFTLLEAYKDRIVERVEDDESTVVPENEEEIHQSEIEELKSLMEKNSGGAKGDLEALFYSYLDEEGIKYDKPENPNPNPSPQDSSDNSTKSNGEESSSSDPSSSDSNNERVIPERYNEFFTRLDKEIGSYKNNSSKKIALEEAKEKFEEVVKATPLDSDEDTVVKSLEAAVGKWKDNEAVKDWDLYKVAWILLGLALFVPTLGANLWVPAIKMGSFGKAVNFWTETKAENCFRKLEETELPAIVDGLSV